MHFLATLLAAALAAVSGPDGKLVVNLVGDDASNLYYTVSYDGAQMLTESPLGLVTNYADFSKLTLTDSETSTISDTYRLDRIKKSTVVYNANVLVAHLTTPDGHPIDIEFRVSNNDVAFRYLIPREQPKRGFRAPEPAGSARVMDEKTGFHFPEGTTTYNTPQSDAMIGWKRTKPSYEEVYHLGVPQTERSEFGHGYTFPCLFRTADGWALVSETGVDSRYCASRLGDYKDGGFKLEFPMPEENNGNGTVEPAFTLPGATPWRTITVGKDLAPIVETTVTWDVVSPRWYSKYDYKYGKGTWSWILWQDDSINYDDQVKYVDLAAAMGFQYVLVDNWWDTNIGRARIEDLVKYAKSKGIDVFLWYSSSGWWNDIEQGPVHVMSDPIARKPEMRWMHEIGVKGIKVDFFGGDKQETMRHYESILSDADDNGLMVIFHGCTIPRGWERMYPNYVGSEAVRASENLIFGQRECDMEAWQATIHPFVRNSLGCMEFGGVFLNKRLDRLNGQPNDRGRVGGTIRRTTDAFELATAVLFQNPIQNFALAPNNLEDAPKLALDFLTNVPTTWDDTKYISGEPGKSAVISRRHGDTLYIAAINADDAPVNFDLKALRALYNGRITVLATVNDEIQTVGEKVKSISVGKNDGAVIIVKL